MSTKSQLVLVTGASGFIGSHIVLRLLETGYRVRGTARGAKATMLRETLGSKYPAEQFEVVEISNIASDDLSTALKDVDAILHVASPLAGRYSAEQTVNIAVEGAMNILRQAVNAKVPKFVLTSSFGTALDPTLAQGWQGVTFTQKSWGDVTREQALEPSRHPLYVYLASKTLAESAAWDYVQEHPELDFATVNPTFVYGPWPEALPKPANATSLGTNGFIYRLIAGEAGRPLPLQLVPYFCDVRDVAQAHVAALEAPAQSELYKKRFLISGGAFTWLDAVKHLSKTRPSLKNRLPSIENAPKMPGELSTIDVSPATDQLKLSEYIGWEKTLEDTVDSILAAEKTW